MTKKEVVKGLDTLAQAISLVNNGHQLGRAWAKHFRELHDLLEELLEVKEEFKRTGSSAG